MDLIFLIIISVGILVSCLYILGQYVLFNKLFLHYKFYSNHKTLVNCLVFLLPISYYIYIGLWTCSHKWCHGFEILFFLYAFIAWIVLVILTFVIIWAYNHFIYKISGKTKRNIDNITIILFLIIFSYFFVTVGGSYLYYNFAILLRNPHLCENTFFEHCTIAIAEETLNPSYCDYEGGYYKTMDPGFDPDRLKVEHYRRCIGAIAKKTHEF